MQLPAQEAEDMKAHSRQPIGEKEQARRLVAYEQYDSDGAAAKSLRMSKEGFVSWRRKRGLPTKAELRYACPNCGEITGRASVGKYRWHDIEADVLREYDRLQGMGLSSSTVRSIYYILGQRRRPDGTTITPLNYNGIQNIGECITRLRLNEKIEWGFFDETLAQPTEHWSGVEDAETWADIRIGAAQSATKNALRSWSSYTLPRWYGQPTLVEVWVEKIGLVPLIELWTRDLGVTVRGVRGKAAWEFGFAALSHIGGELREPFIEEARVIYLGDLDPSGISIPAFFEEKVIPHFVDHLDIKKPVRLAHFGVLPDQVERFGLPPDPEPEHAEKAKNDPNKLRWKDHTRLWRERGYQVRLVELDALLAKEEDAMPADQSPRMLIRNEIERHFDSDVDRQARVLETERQDVVRRRIEAALGASAES